MPKSTTTTTILLLLLFPFFIHATTSSSSSPSTIIKAGFWPSWSFQTLPPSSINFSYFTHLFYAFIPLDPTTFQLSISPFHHLWLTNFTTTVHSQTPPLSALLSIAGGAFNRTIIANLVSNPTSRATFINSTISIALHYNLDGFDFDWEFPANPEQMDNLALLYKEWRAAITCLLPTKVLLLTSSVYFSPDFFLSIVPRSYPVAVMAETLDWINAMCFDYHGWWNTSETGLHAALYDPEKNISTSFGLGTWIREGMPAKKVVLGMPLYGRTWELKESEEHGVGSPAVNVGPGKGGKGIMVYGAIVRFNEENNATVVHDEERVAVYSYAGKSWLGYDDEWSVRKKVEYGMKMGLGGYFFWALGF
ncbi:class V chitinase CHIT5-like [Dioscorea cayenensis subsp. rotundata]|uniref:Class V chitinase CHIT5-like n=1 Tax=Dioscorea cayennensis subsp. rotundata TaxID=55577 RepID=A0AB40AM86_DIOCR|nr:class V chitinase CHIT5-like [Dioscorea cayenensis subsp. rotundata]